MSCRDVVRQLCVLRPLLELIPLCSGEGEGPLGVPACPVAVFPLERLQCTACITACYQTTTNSLCQTTDYSPVSGHQLLACVRPPTTRLCQATDYSPVSGH